MIFGSKHILVFTFDDKFNDIFNAINICEVFIKILKHRKTIINNENKIHFYLL